MSKFTEERRKVVGILQEGLGSTVFRLPDRLRERRLRTGPLGSIEQKEFGDLIIAAVVVLGGAAGRTLVVDFICDEWGTQLHNADFEMLNSQTPPKERWIHNVDWAKRQLVIDGRLRTRREVPYGLWALSERGAFAAITLMG